MSTAIVPELTGEFADRELATLYGRLGHAVAAHNRALESRDRVNRKQLIVDAAGVKERIWNRIRDRKAVIQAGGVPDETPAMNGRRLAQWDR